MSFETSPKSVDVTFDAQGTEIELAQKSTELELAARSIKVVAPEDLQTARDFLLDIKREKDRRVAFFKPMKEKAHAAHKAITQQEKESLTPLESAESIINKEIRDYNTRVCAAAKKLADEEAAKKREEGKAAALAGDMATFRLKKEEEKAVAAIVPQAPKPVVDGGSFRKVTTVTIYDHLEFVKFIASQASGAPPVAYLKADIAKIERWCSDMKISEHTGNGFTVKQELGDMIVRRGR